MYDKGKGKGKGTGSGPNGYGVSGGSRLYAGYGDHTASGTLNRQQRRSHPYHQYGTPSARSGHGRLPADTHVQDSSRIKEPRSPVRGEAWVYVWARVGDPVAVVSAFVRPRLDGHRHGQWNKPWFRRTDMDNGWWKVEFFDLDARDPLDQWLQPDRSGQVHVQLSPPDVYLINLPPGMTEHGLCGTLYARPYGFKVHVVKLFRPQYDGWLASAKVRCSNVQFNEDLVRMFQNRNIRFRNGVVVRAMFAKPWSNPQSQCQSRPPSRSRNPAGVSPARTIHSGPPTTPPDVECRQQPPFSPEADPPPPYSPQCHLPTSNTPQTSRQLMSLYAEHGFTRPLPYP